MVTPLPQLEVFVRKVDQDASAEDLALFLRKKKVPVVKCRMRPSGALRNKGFATLTLETAKDLENLMARTKKEEFQFKRKVLEIARSKGGGSAPQDSEKIFRFKGKVQLGVLRSGNEFLTKWNVSESSSDRHVQLVVNFQAKYVKFSYRDERAKEKRHVRYHLFDVEKIVQIILATRRNAHALVLRTKTAPKLFQESLTSSLVTHFLWELVSTDEAGANSTRSLDFSPGDSLSVYGDLLFELDDVPSELFVQQAIIAGCDYLGQDKPWRVGESPLPAQPQPKADLDLPFEIKFQMEILFAEGILYRELLPRQFYSVLAAIPEDACLAVIAELRRSAQNSIATCQFVRWFPIPDPVASAKATEAFTSYEETLKVKSNPRLTDSVTSVGIHRALVSPLRTFPLGPDGDIPNRVLRQYSHLLDHFLRVSFADEDHNRLMLQGDKMAHITAHFRGILQDGLTVAGRRFTFLGMSNSQMREHSAWFFHESETAHETTESIRKWMGDFSGIRVVAKYAARMGLCFTSTVSTKTCMIKKDEFEEVPDIEKMVGTIDVFYRKTKTYNFTDGVGTISPEFAEVVAKSTNHNGQGTPSAFQIRFGGYKGVVAVDRRLAGKKIKLQLRPSMHKFESNHYQLEVCNPCSFTPAHINRQIILLLSSLKVSDKVFIERQAEMLNNLDSILEDPKAAVDYLTRTASLGPHSTMAAVVEMMKAGFDPKSEPYVHDVLQSHRTVQLDNVRKRARIFVEKAACLMGVIDETKTLKNGEMFIQVKRVTGGPFVVTGPVVVTKNPCFHPGDIRVLQAVNKPVLSHLVNVVTFPAKGDRPHTDEISGSDLDGDLYFVSWDSDLLPLEKYRNDEPMDYTAPEPKTKSPITLDDVKDFFIDFIKSDQLGLIANAHLAHADTSLSGAKDPKCIKLAEMHSLAVDFPKTGVLPKLTEELRPKAYPDFMEKPDKVSYPSRGILNKLFRKASEFKQSSARQQPPVKVDKALRYEGYEDYLEDARDLMESYNDELLDMMNSYGIQSESEMITGNIVLLGRLMRNKRISSVRIEIREKMIGLVRAYRKEFNRGLETHSAKLAKASALYFVTYSRKVLPTAGLQHSRHLISCPWIVHDYLTEIKTACV
eukprot:m.2323 g.2323  ORF g.2323 m.2323 type:complete len:1118 (+) comp8576_c0_seq1:109-3462(+)